jgi:hemerythrin-like domain-containing protein/quercetin dioxygenase-like cupin family protein
MVNQATTTTPTLEVCESLIREHRQMEALLAEFKTALVRLDGNEPERVAAFQTLLGRIETEMNTHFACEEEALFPAVSPYHPMVLMEAEHEELIGLRDELLERTPRLIATGEGLPEIQATGNRLIQELLDHIVREDGGIFPACERALSEAEKQGVVSGMNQIRQAARLTPTHSIQRPERVSHTFRADLSKPLERSLFSAKLFEQPHLEIKHLTIRAGESLPAHWSPKTLVLVCMQGQGTARVGAEAVALEPGVGLVMSPRLQHTVQAQTDCHLLLLLMPE